MNDDNGGRPGVLATIGAVIRYIPERIALSESIVRNDRLLMQGINQRIQESVARVQPDHDEFENRLTATADRELDSSSAEALRLQAQKASVKAPHMRGYLGSLGRFVVGVGPTFTPELEDSVKDAAEEWWKGFKRLNKWDEALEDEIPHRTWRDGEVFNRFFVQETEGSPDDWEPDPELMTRLSIDVDELAPPDVPAGMTFIRMIPPEQIRDPDGKVSHGILTAKRDVCTPLAYFWAPDEKKLEEVIMARDIQHIKINVDQDVKRGRSQLEVLLKRNKQYEDWLGYRILLNLFRTSIVLIKKITGATPTQVQALKDKWASKRTDNTQTNRAQMPRPGSTIHSTEGVEHEFISPNLQATDAQHDGRSILLSMCAATGLPDYMITGDASNANFASTMVAESPAVREFQRWQDFFTPHFQEIYRRVMVNGAEAGQIKGLSVEQAETMGISVDWPPLLARNELEHAKATQIKMVTGILSKEGAAAEDGIDWPVEKERLAGERQDAVEFTAPMGDQE